MKNAFPYVFGLLAFACVEAVGESPPINVVVYQKAESVSATSISFVVVEIVNLGSEIVPITTEDVQSEYYAVNAPKMSLSAKPIREAEVRLLIDKGPAFVSKVFMQSMAGGHPSKRQMQTIAPFGTLLFKLAIPPNIAEPGSVLQAMCRVRVAEELVADSKPFRIVYLP